jgi:hypothetical protein
MRAWENNGGRFRSTQKVARDKFTPQRSAIAAGRFISLPNQYALISCNIGNRLVTARLHFSPETVPTIYPSGICPSFRPTTAPLSSSQFQPIQVIFFLEYLEKCHSHTPPFQSVFIETNPRRVNTFIGLVLDCSRSESRGFKRISTTDGTDFSDGNVFICVIRVIRGSFFYCGFGALCSCSNHGLQKSIMHHRSPAGKSGLGHPQFRANLSYSELIWVNMTSRAKKIEASPSKSAE